jgi:hypothetical protein
MSYDSFREQADDNVFVEPEKPVEAAPTPSRRRARRRQGNFLGMTAPQRFIIAIMLLMMVCLLGTLCLLVTQKIYFPM